MISDNSLSETDLIKYFLSLSANDASLKVANGDDAAVFSAGDLQIVISTDSYIENIHFETSYCSYFSIGFKAIEASGSDIVAMGALPHFFLVALGLPENYSKVQVQELYSGINASLKRLNAVLIGGDTCLSGQELVLNITALGTLEAQKRPLLRSGAQPGDMIAVSGKLGSARAGFELLKKGISGFEGLKKKFLEPACRVDLVGSLTELASSCIDISDGVASEIRHVCRMSGVGAVIYEEKLPFYSELPRAAELAGISLNDCLLCGGEDYELLYTISPEKKAEIEGTVIGEITYQREIIIENSSGRRKLTEEGFDHFNRGTT
ncbi:MAG: thiamine-phosphate kinase [Candidatus Dadabacteria bacterium]|nr:MAG: thiamine-phosphate kinase [Candidatus Dadabacteria bacterium]